MKSNTFLLLLLILVSSCSSNEDLPTVKDVDLTKYQGTWYEIARLPNRFEKGLKCVTANYTPDEDGTIKVINKGINTEDQSKSETAIGKAKVPDAQFPGQIKVSFFGPFYGDYYIIDLDENYHYALVGDPSRKYLWILSRTPKIDNEIYNSLITKAEKLGFNVSELHLTKQDCN
nr:lipocalin family protein [uncultured Carboxylicivirga sp.]